MFSPERFVSYWGASDLFAFPPDLLQSVNIPETSKVFLRDAGLPFTANAFGRSYVLLPIKPLTEARFTLLVQSPFVSPRYRLLATLRRYLFWRPDNNDTYFAIEEGTGQVWLVGPPIFRPHQPHDRGDRDTFVNSSVAQYAEFLAADREIRAWNRFDRFYDAPSLQRIDALEKRWREIDPTAMASDTHWWLAYINDLRNSYGQVSLPLKQIDSLAQANALQEYECATLSPEKFALQWGTVDLFRFPSNLLEDNALPKNANALLCQVGLPLEVWTPPGLCFIVLPLTLEDSLVPAAKHLLLSRASFTSTHYLLLALLVRDNTFWIDHHFWDGRHPLYLAVQADSGHMRVVGPAVRNIYEPEYIDYTPDYFANSSLSHLMEFFLAGRMFTAHYWFRWFYARGQVPALIDALERQWWRIDPQAMADPENWWPKNVESLRRLYQHRMTVSDG